MLWHGSGPRTTTACWLQHPGAEGCNKPLHDALLRLTTQKRFVTPHQILWDIRCIRKISQSSWSSDLELLGSTIHCAITRLNVRQSILKFDFEITWLHFYDLIYSRYAQTFLAPHYIIWHMNCILHNILVSPKVLRAQI